MKKIIRKAKLSLMINWRFLCKFHISTIKSKIQTRFMDLNTRDSKVNESKLVSGQTGKIYNKNDKNREAFACFVAQNLKIC